MVEFTRTGSDDAGLVLRQFHKARPLGSSVS